MQTINVLTTQNVTIQYPVASLGDRIVAFLIDMVILIFYTIAIIALFINIELEVWWVWMVFTAFPWMFYHVAFEIFMNGQSPGKRAMQIQVVRLDGTEPTIGNYLIRWIFGFIDFWLLSGAVAVVVIAVSGKGQRLGDVVAGTSVVKLITQRDVSSNDIFITPQQSYTPVFSQAVHLQATDVELIQRAIEANAQHGNQRPAIIVTEKLKSLLGIQSNMPPIEFLHTIVKDYNHLTSK